MEGCSVIQFYSKYILNLFEFIILSAAVDDDDDYDDDDDDDDDYSDDYNDYTMIVPLLLNLGPTIPL